MKKTRSMVASLVAIVICFAMLLGTTYAWFTDSVINTNNIIKSGNVNVELYHTSIYDAMPVGFGFVEEKSEKVNGTTKLFTNTNDQDILWEPGAIAGETFRIANEGTLALKYEFSLRVLSKSFTESGKSLTDVLTLEVAKLGYNEGSIAPFVPAGEEIYCEILNDGHKVSGTLLAGETVDYLFDITWIQSEIDNEYNVEGGLFVRFGIELVATQVSYESDGYGAGFDNGAQFPNVSSNVTLDEVPAGESAVIETKGEKPVSATVPAEVIDALPDEVTTLSLVHTEPFVENGNVVFESVELVDQNGQIVELEELNLTEKITVTLPVEGIQDGMPVDVFHDDVKVASAVVTDGKIAYEVDHFCEIKVIATGEVIDGEIFVGASTAEELASALANGTSVYLKNDITINQTLQMAPCTLNGNGNTIFVEGAAGRGFVVVNPQGGTIKNVNFENKYTFWIGQDYAIGSNQFASTTLTEDLYVENVKTKCFDYFLDLNANGNSVYVKDCEVANSIQVGNAEMTTFEGCHFFAEETTKTSNAAKQSLLLLLGDMTFTNCHFEEDVNMYLDSPRYSGTIYFNNSTYGNNGVEDRPIDSFGFIKYWFPAFGVINYPGTFGDTRPANTVFSWYIDGVCVWEATGV